MPTSIEFVQGDLAAFAADAVVNAANAELRPGGGVDGALHRAAGPSLAEECRAIGICAPGAAVATGAGQLPAKHVFHAVGPVYRGKEKDVEQLASCHLACLDLARDRGCRSIAFPAISTGAYGYPVAEASVIAVGSVHGWLLKNPGVLDRIVFVFRDPAVREAYAAAHGRRSGR
jgi:O-acetyl-ADP-ribose deacetylase (regulator of RNase III)